MKHLVIFLLSLMLFSNSSRSQVKEGSKIPAFQLKDQDGKDFDISGVLGQPLVIYFYPKDETSVCTKEACSFRDAYEDFTKYGARVIGISGDGVESHKRFAANHQLPFTLLADTANTVRKLFGVPKTLMIPGRVTYVVNREGIVVHTFNSLRDGEKHVTEALAAVKKM